MAETPVRKYRMPDEDYEQAQAAISKKGETVADVIRHALHEEVVIEERKASGRELSPEPPNGRQWFEYRRGKIVGTQVWDDRTALEHIALGWDLWPVEWGMK